MSENDFHAIDEFMKQKGYTNRSAFLVACAREHMQTVNLLPDVQSSFASVFGMLAKRLVGNASDDDLNKVIDHSSNELKQLQGQVNFDNFFDDASRL